MGSTVTQIDVKGQIEKYFKEYAMYVLQQRGIPNFYDALTPSQRLILLHAPSKLEATVGLIGRVMQTGLYHHGDSSIQGAIARCARPFLCSDPLLEGDGFFGSPVKPKAASPRYTKVKSKKWVSERISKYSDINERNDEGGYDWLYVDLPLGLAGHIVGIAVGYSSIILPRKMSDVEEYLSGKPKKLYPHLAGFSGKISKGPDSNGKCSWLIEGSCEVDDKAMSISVTSLPPLMRYDTFLTKLHASLLSLDPASPFKILNESKTDVKVVVQWRDRLTFQSAKDVIQRAIRMIVVETVVFVRDGVIIEYGDIKQYLDDFRVHIEVVKLKRLTYDVAYDQGEAEFLRAKIAFMEFMLEKKRTNGEIRGFTSSYRGRIKARLEAIKLVDLSKETLKDTQTELADIEKKILEAQALLKSEKARVATLQRSYKSAAALHVGGDGGGFSADLDFGDLYQPEDDIEPEAEEIEA